MPAVASTQGNGEKDNVKFYPEEDLVSLIRSLDRPEDKAVFSQDVLVTYPHLAATYTKVCPKRCDLATAARNAQAGAYSYEPDLASLKEDIRLMVSNCIRFNGEDSWLAGVATSFEAFALGKIQAYMEGKAGGRRASSLRFLQSSATAATPSSSKATAGPAVSSSFRGGGASAGGKKHPSQGPSAEETFPKKELTQLVSSLVRREDADAFVVDVAAVYPELREAYEAACPHKMNLNMMRQRAQSGYYTQGPEPVVGATVADCLPRLREDVELVVGNCVRFNAQVEAWVSLARGFQTFAHRRIDDVVLRKLPQLRGTETGAARYANPSSTAPPPAVASAGAAVAATAPEQPTTEAAEAPLAAAKRKTLRWATPSTTGVQVVADVVPSITPTPLQPALTVPLRLRQRLAADYVRQESLPLRLVGTQLPLSEVLTVMPAAANASAAQDELKGEYDKEEEEDKNGPRAAKAAKHEGEATAASPSSVAQDGPAAASPSPMDTPILVCAKLSAAAVLQAFEASVRSFFRGQRERPDFVDAFQFNAHEEASYLRVVRVVAEQFEALFPHVLLYEGEAVALRHHSAQQHMQRPRPQQAASSETTEAKAAEDGTGDPADMPWMAQVHYSYLVRLLVQFPQIASLTVASTLAEQQQPQHQLNSRKANSNGSRSSVSTLHTADGLSISQDAAMVMRHVTKICQEFLYFIGEYEEKLVPELEQAVAQSSPIAA